jgi:2-(1,2-epoxy-1,2-dihydrophenyl)acetyl-CoA isomerase
MAPLVVLQRVGAVGTLTLNRAERHNSLIPALLEEVLGALETVRADSNLRAVVLQANGRSFSAGGDLRGFWNRMDSLETYARRLVGLLNEVIIAMIELPLPVVGAVHGIVTGGSLGLVLSCDVVLVAPEASFTPYYGVIGFGPDGGWTAMLPSIIGARQAAAVLLQNLTITADQAVEWGLASRVVPAERIRDEALATALETVAQKPGAISQIKQLLSAAHGDLAARLEVERTRFVEHIVSEEARQGIAAFVEGWRP